MRYIDYIKDQIPDKNDYAFTFYKQNGYRSEQEFRVAIRNEDQSAKILEEPLLISIKPDDLIEKIVISPWASGWQEKALKRIISSLGYDKNIVKSSSVSNIQ